MNPLKGWARKNTTLPDTLSIQQAGIDGAGLGLEFVEALQASFADQVAGVVVVLRERLYRPPERSADLLHDRR